MRRRNRRLNEGAGHEAAVVKAAKPLPASD